MHSNVSAISQHQNQKNYKTCFTWSSFCTQCHRSPIHPTKHDYLVIFVEKGAAMCQLFLNIRTKGIIKPVLRWVRFCSQCHRSPIDAYLGMNASLLHFSTHVTSTVTRLLRYSLLSSWYLCKKWMLLPCVWFCVWFFGTHLVHNFRNRSFAMISCIFDIYCTFLQQYHDESN